MQIYKHDNSVRLPDTPHASFGTGGLRPAAKSEHSHESPTPLSRDREFSQLSGLLSEVPDLRTEVVEQAKADLARGDFLTRRAAEETAAKFLGTDASQGF
jgi:hypothetical protein